MAQTIPFWLHLLAAAAWIGPQLYIFFVQVPALRTIADVTVRHTVTDIIVHRFNLLAWGALLVLVLTGLGNVFDRNAAFAVFDFDRRYAWILVTKLSLVALTTALTFWHSFVLGPRLLALQVPAESDTQARISYRALRIQSIILNVLNLLIGLAILFAAGLLARHEFSLEQA